MQVPENIRNVKRPEHTIVFVYGKNKDKYGVKVREYVNIDGKVKQKDGATIGWIRDGQFVPKDFRPKILYGESDFLYWADIQLATNLSNDIYDDLKAVYNNEDAKRCYVLALLRAVEHGIKDDEIKSAYEDSYAHILFPDVALSKNTVGEFINNLGRRCSLINEFTKLRMDRVRENHYLAVDGMLKSDESDINSFSEKSRKAITKGTKDVSVLFAFDTDLMEPVCSTVYPGNVLDIAAFRDFIETNSISKGVIIADKGFSYNAAKDKFRDNPDLHFIIPLKRNAAVLEQYKVLHFDSSLSNRFGVEYRKVRVHDGKYLYSFKDFLKAKNEEETWISKNESFDPKELEDMRLRFGTIVFLCDLDAPAGFIYSAYEERWEIEVLFRLYKSILELDETRVVDDKSLIGTEFINLLSVIIMCRMRKAFLNNRTLCKRSFCKNMRFLRKGVMVRRDANDDWHPRKITQAEEFLFIELGIIKNDSVPKPKVGRPPKTPFCNIDGNMICKKRGRPPKVKEQAE